MYELTNNEKTLLDFQRELKSNPLMKFADQVADLGTKVMPYRILTTFFMLAGIMLFGSVMDAFGQSQPNPFGGNAASKTSSTVSTVIKALSWIAFAAGIGAVIWLGIAIIFKQEWKHLAIGAAFCFGLSYVVGSFLYAVFNEESVGDFENISLD